MNLPFSGLSLPAVARINVPLLLVFPFRPFERTAADNGQIEACLEMIPKLTSQVSADVLKELCVVSQLDVWKDDCVTSKSMLTCCDADVC